jgi:polygalacturonase
VTRVVRLAALALASLPLVALPLAAQQGYQGVPGSPVFNVATFGALCDGATNFTAQIQAAASAVPSSGGVLYFPRSAGACVVSSSITITNPTAVVADSAVATSIKLANAANAHVFNVTSSNVGFYNLTINANGSNQGSASYNGINFSSGLSGLRVQGCVIQNAAKDNLYLISDSHVLVTQTTLSGAGNDQFNYETTASVTSSDIKFVNNTVDSTAITTSFVAVYAVDAIGAGSTVTDVTVEDNTVHIPLTAANETDGIVVNGNTTGSVSRVTVEGNNVAATSGSGSTNSNGIEIAKGVDDFAVAHNTVSLMYQGMLVQNCTASGCAASGLREIR